jgi:hypothetical protein
MPVDINIQSFRLLASLVMWMARSGRWRFWIIRRRFGFGGPQIVCWGPNSEITSAHGRERCKCFSGKKLSASAPMIEMHV